MNALESANMNLQTMEAMKRGSEALKGIHGKMCERLSFFQALSRTWLT